MLRRSTERSRAIHGRERRLPTPVGTPSGAPARLCRRYVLEKAAKAAKEKLGVSVEIIDLRTLLPWDTETVFNSVRFNSAPPQRAAWAIHPSGWPLVRRGSALAAQC